MKAHGVLHGWFFGVLCVVVVAALGGCVDGMGVPYSDEVVTESITHTGNPIPVVIRVGSGPRVSPGERVEYYIQPPTVSAARLSDGTGWEVPDSETWTAIWVPPQGALSIGYTVVPEPGGSPYVFEGLLLNEPLRVWYTTPMRQGALKDTVFQVMPPAASGSLQGGGVVRLTEVEQSSATSATSALMPESYGSAAVGTGLGLKVTQSVKSEIMDLDTSGCEQMRTALSSGKLVVAVRAPLRSDVQDGNSVPLPLLFNGTDTQELALWDIASATPILTATLGYTPAYFQRLEKLSPVADDEYWLALDATGVSGTCPTGLQVPAGTWRSDLTLMLDTEALASDYARRGLMMSYCWVGTESPFGTAFAGLQTQRFEAANGDAFTCYAPVPLDVNPAVGLTFTDLESSYQSDTRTLSVVEVLRNDAAESVQVAVARDTTLPSPWEMYISAVGDTTVTGPLAESATFEVGSGDDGAVKLWFRNTVSAETEAGGYSLSFTATAVLDPQLTAYDTVPLWVGDWVPSLVEDYRVFLPLIVREEN